ncbi:hypothetical protein LTR78_008774 [Recurvomyces mirabilis]|uniref:Uncharacterized protein n=2 Tax=Recurvomyces mirabilis TaxID=574656 RepID=A0AAE0TUC6_9PEZI|nr:hypothetical protein LTR78_008774 [Recurvomyces mirabilis]
MVFFIPVLLVIAGVALVKQAKEHKKEKRSLKIKNATKGHGTVYYNAAAQDTKLQDGMEQSEVLPVYRHVDNEDVTLPVYSMKVAS